MWMILLCWEWYFKSSSPVLVRDDLPELKEYMRICDNFFCSGFIFKLFREAVNQSQNQGMLYQPHSIFFIKSLNRLTFAPIWLPHWPAWMWTISLMVEWLPRARVESLPAGGGVSRALPNLPPASFPEQPTATPCHLYSPGKGSNYTKSIQGRQGQTVTVSPYCFSPVLYFPPYCFSPVLYWYFHRSSQQTNDSTYENYSPWMKCLANIKNLQNMYFVFVRCRQHIS